MPLLTEDEFRVTMDLRPVAVGVDDEPPFDFWDYFDTVPAEDCDGHDFSEGIIDHSWRMPLRQYEHVLVSTDAPDVFLVLILDTRRGLVLGHHLLKGAEIYETH